MLSAAALGPCKPLTTAPGGSRRLPRSPSAAPVVANWRRCSQRLAVAARYHTGGHHTASQPPPVDPNYRTRAFRKSPNGRKEAEKEPFDAELFTLFGLPVACLVIAYAFNEPSSLAVAIPLGLLIPGVRDVLLHVGADAFRAVRRTARFVSVDSGGDFASEEDVAAVEEARARQATSMQWWQQRQEQQQVAWGRRAPPPPPPPPSAPQAEYELRADDYAVYPAPPAQPASEPQEMWPQQQAWPQQPWQPDWQQQQQQQQQSWQQQPGQTGQQADWQAEQQLRSPFAEGWPQQQQPHSPFAEGWPQQQQPRSPFAEGWPQEQQPHSSFADGWPPAGDSGTGSAGHGASWQQAPAAPNWNASAAPNGADSWRFRRSSRGGGSPAAAAAPSSGSPSAMVPSRRRRPGRLPQPGGQGRAQVKTGAVARRRDAPPLLLRPLFALIPFLRHWGGFL